jgi:adenosine deaminase CECR1
MWDSTMTDEFFVAVTEFNLSWDEIRALSRNSLQYSFAQPAIKQNLLLEFDERMSKFELGMQKYGTARLASMPPTRGFICTRYQLCSPDQGQ